MSARDTARAAYRVVRDRQVAQHAAAFAYYAFTSIVPAVAVVVVLGTLLGGEAFVSLLVDQVRTVLSGSAQTQVTNALLQGAGRTGAGLGGAVVLLWSVFKVVRALDLGFAAVYDLRDHATLAEQVKDGSIVFVLVAGAVALMVGVGVLLGARTFAFVPYPLAAGAFVLFVGLVAVFLPLYYVLPPVEMSVREALPGAVAAAVGWMAMQVVFYLYLSNAGRYAAFGLLGAVILFVTWIYLGGLVLLLGGVVNFVLSYGRAENRLGPTPDV